MHRCAAVAAISPRAPSSREGGPSLGGPCVQVLLLTLPLPHIACADIGAWAAITFERLSSASLRTSRPAGRSSRIDAGRAAGRGQVQLS